MAVAKKEAAEAAATEAVAEKAAAEAAAAEAVASKEGTAELLVVATVVLEETVAEKVS